MRIRKRKVPLPLSLLSPIPLSDPHLFSQFPMHHQPQPSDHISPTSASDLLPPISSNTNNNTVVSSAVVKKEEEVNEQCLGFQGGGGGGGERILQHKSSNNNNNNDVDDDDGSKQETTTTTTATKVPNVAVRWSEGERVIPLKKRRSSGSFLSSEKVVNEDEDKDNNNNNKQKRGTTIMEGSRCSRVNGRGWRCCQATLVGYSLCEHHLGKGRLRSMTTVRGRPAKKQHQPDDHHKKRVSHKLGVVKARSLSSLLGQVSNTVAVDLDLDLDLNVNDISSAN